MNCTIAFCGAHGACVDGACACEPFAGGGGNCTDLWKDDASWYETFRVVQGLGAALYFAIGIVAFLQVDAMIRKHRSLPDEIREARGRFPLHIAIAIEILVVQIIRGFYLAVDPRGLNGVLGHVGFTVLSQFTVQLWIVISFQIILVWLAIKREAERFTNKSRTERVVWAIVAILLAGSVFITVWSGVEATQQSSAVSTAYIIVVTIIFAVIVLGAGIPSLWTMRSIGMLTPKQREARRLVFYLFGILGLYALFIIYGRIKIALGHGDRDAYTVTEGVGRVIENFQPIVSLALFWTPVTFRCRSEPGKNEVETAMTEAGTTFCEEEEVEEE
jgi:hypothetical protein